MKRNGAHWALSWVSVSTAAHLYMAAWSTPAHADKNVVVIVHNGFGTTAGARVWGRVLEDRGLNKSQPDDGTWTKIKRSISDFESDEIEGADVKVLVLGKSYPVKADSEGLFRLDLKGPLPQGDHVVDARVDGYANQFCETGRLFVRPSGTGCAVISDVDDTILRTGVTGSKATLVKNVVVSNAYDLQTYEGAPSVFQAFARRECQIVFVSASPINLYLRLKQFLDIQGFPPSVFLLKNLGVEAGADSITDHESYKQRRIQEVQELLPGYRFILIGDSGEKDPEVYSKVKSKSPAQVLAILIHRVTLEASKSKRFDGETLFESYDTLKQQLVPMKLLPEDFENAPRPKGGQR